MHRTSLDKGCDGAKSTVLVRVTKQCSLRISYKLLNLFLCIVVVYENKLNNNFYLSIEEKLIIIFYLTFPLW